jgi:hypothetical protein
LICWIFWSLGCIFVGGLDNVMASHDPRYKLIKETKQSSASALRTYWVVTDPLSADITLERLEITLLPGVKWVEVVDWAPTR